MKELISISVVLIFCLSFLIFGTRESQAIAANFGIPRTGRKRAMNRNQVIFYLLSALFESMCQPSERNLENVHYAVHFVFKVKQSSFLNPRFGLREVWTLIFFSFLLFLVLLSEHWINVIMITVSDYRSQTPGYSSNADRNKGETTFLFSVDLCLLLFVINIIITIIVTIITLLSILLCSRQVFLLFIHCIAGSKLWT